MSQSQLERKDRFALSPSARARQLDDEVILLDIQAGEYFSLNASGAAVWQGIERGLDLGTIESEIASAWPVPAEERWEMVIAVVSDLLDRKLISHLE